MSINKEEIAIFLNVQEIERENKNNFDINELMAEVENIELTNSLNVQQMYNYAENYTLKELLMICEYYGCAKELKHNKYNKQQIINFLVMFELDIKNSDIVFKRQNMWFYINQLKNDKFMKKFILW